jgi:Flp pilus assembly protein TadD
VQHSIFTDVQSAAQHARDLLVSDPAQAARQVRALLSGKPRDPALLRLLGASLRRQDDLDGAARAEQQAIALSKEQPLHRMAAELLAAGERDRARGALQSQLKKEKDDVLALVGLG